MLRKGVYRMANKKYVIVELDKDEKEIRTLDETFHTGYFAKSEAEELKLKKYIIRKMRKG